MRHTLDGEAGPGQVKVTTENFPADLTNNETDSASVFIQLYVIF